ncbi:MAG TPA: ABC transporter substrate-binding protein [Candidatus Paceibacterota bacterium]
MASFFSFLSHKKIPSPQKLRALLRGEMTAYRKLAIGLFIAVLTAAFFTLVAFHNSFLVTVPAPGGALSEGIIGAPKSINPVLAMTDTDIALTHLIYAGLMKETSAGDIIPELAESYTLSPDSRTYTVTLRDAKFHDGKKLTSNDVLFTVGKLQNSALNPAQTAYWGDVGVETPDEATVVFRLPSPRADFLRRMTVGILPEHVWADIADENFATAPENVHPVGAGAFKLARTASERGVATLLVFKRNHNYVLGAPLLKKLSVHIFNNQNELMSAVEDGDVDVTLALAPETLRDSADAEYSVAPITTPTEATLYHLRGDGGALANAAFVTVLAQYIDKERIIDIVENGYGTPIEESGSLTKENENAHDRLLALGYRLQNGTLMKNGSSVGFSIATINTPSNTALANALAEEVRALGVTVSVRSFDPGFFQSALASGAFNAILAKGASPSNAYEAVIPLYTTTIPFVTKTDAHGIIPPVLISPVLRYANVNDWYVNTDRLYPGLAKKKTENTNY